MVSNYIKKKKTINLKEIERKFQKEINVVKEGKCFKRAAEDIEVKHTTLNQKIEYC